MNDNVSAMAKEPNVFELIHNRIESFSSRVRDVGAEVECAVNRLHGTIPMDPEGKKDSDKTHDPSLLAGIQRVLNELDNEIDALKNQQSRLSDLLR